MPSNLSSPSANRISTPSNVDFDSELPSSSATSGSTTPAAAISPLPSNASYISHNPINKNIDEPCYFKSKLEFPPSTGYIDPNTKPTVLYPLTSFESKISAGPLSSKTNDSKTSIPISHSKKERRSKNYYPLHNKSRSKSPENPFFKNQSSFDDPDHKDAKQNSNNQDKSNKPSSITLPSSPFPLRHPIDQNISSPNITYTNPSASQHGIPAHHNSTPTTIPSAPSFHHTITQHKFRSPSLPVNSLMLPSVQQLPSTVQKIYPSEIEDLLPDEPEFSNTLPSFHPNIKTLFVDVRPYAQYSKSRIKTAINICLPSTLLKRPTFTITRFGECMIPFQRPCIENLDQYDSVIIYDQSTEEMSTATYSPLLFTILKFSKAENLKGKLYYLHGGISLLQSKGSKLYDSQFIDYSETTAQISKDGANNNNSGQPNLASNNPAAPHNSVSPSSSSSASSSFSSNSSASVASSVNSSDSPLKKLGTSHTFNFPPVLTGFSLPFSSTKDGPIKPFASNLNHLLDNVDYDLSPVRLPDDMDPEELESYFPTWLKDVINPESGPSKIARRFHDIEKAEKVRVNTAFQIKSQNNSSNMNSATPTIIPPVGVETKGNIDTTPSKPQYISLMIKPPLEDCFKTPQIPISTTSINGNNACNSCTTSDQPAGYFNIVPTEENLQAHSSTTGPLNNLNTPQEFHPKPDNNSNSYFVSNLNTSSEVPSEELLTPDDAEFKYSFSAGVELGTKNRYSNIWPYDHTRVRLPETLIEESTHSTPVDNKDMGKIFSHSNNHKENDTESNDNSNIEENIDSPEIIIDDTKKNLSQLKLNTKNASKNAHSDQISSSPTLKNSIKISTPTNKTSKNLADDNGNDYINASYLCAKGSRDRYIATQGPLPDTFNDFWHLVWAKKISMIIMLTAEIEGGQIKCHRYWNDGIYGKLKLSLVSEEKRKLSNATGNFVTIRTFSLAPISYFKSSLSSRSSSSSNTTPHTVVQIQYASWPDLGSPTNPDDLIEISQIKEEIMENLAKNAPKSDSSDTCSSQMKRYKPWVIVHCSAGCGRTGTFCTVDSIIEFLKEHGIFALPRRYLLIRKPNNDFSSPAILTATTATIPKNDTSESFIDYFSSDRTTETQPSLAVLPGEPSFENYDFVYRTVHDFRRQRLGMVQVLRQYVLCYETIIVWIHQRYLEEKKSKQKT